MYADSQTARRVGRVPAAADPGGLGRRALTWAILCLFAFMSVGWRTWGDTPLGVLRYFHLPMLFVLVLARRRGALFRSMTPLVAVGVLYTVIYTAFSLYNGVPPYALQQAVYLAAAFSVAASLRGATQRDWRILRWAGPLAVGIFLIVFWIDARSVGIDSIATYREGIASGNLNIIQFSLFQRVFNASLGGAPVNSTALRGQVFAGILVPIYVSIYACTVVPRRQALFSIAYWSSIVIGAPLILLSLARALQLAAFLALALPAVRSLVSKVRYGVVYRLCIGLGIIAMGLSTPVASLVWQRLTGDTASYNARGGAWANTFETFASSPIVGSYTSGDALSSQTGEFSAHNFILDAAVIGGVLTGFLALAVVVFILRDTFRGFRYYLRDSTFLAPLAAALLAPVAMFTSGSGTLQMPDCMGLALFYGALSARRRRAARSADHLSPEGQRGLASASLNSLSG